MAHKIYSKKRDPARRWRSFLKHSLILAKALLISSTLTLLWYGVRKRGVHFAHDDEGILNTTITNLGVLYNLFAAVTIALVSDKYPKMSRAVLKNDKEAFLLMRDERLAITMNMITGIMASTLLFMMGGIEYKSAWSGFASMFSISLIMSLIFVGVRDLQDVTRSDWFKERTPKDWLIADIDDEFLKRK